MPPATPLPIVVPTTSTNWPATKSSAASSAPTSIAASWATRTCRIDDVEHALMGPDLKLLARLLVDVRRTQNGEFLDLGRQRDRTAYARAGTLGRADDLAGRLVEHAMIVRPQADPDILAVHCYVPSCLSRLPAT